MMMTNVDKLDKDIYFWTKGSWAPEHTEAFNDHIVTGIRVQFVPDPTNEYDPNAISVCIYGEPIGYVGKEHCESFLKLMNAGYFPKVTVKALSEDDEAALVTGKFIIKKPGRGIGFALGRFFRFLIG